MFASMPPRRPADRRHAVTTGRLLVLAPLALLAACGGDEGAVISPGTAPAPIRHHLALPPHPASPPSAHILALPGLEGVIGASAGGLTRAFGQPRLDVIEGDARKLQFSSSACVLDVYLYPPRGGAEPVATYVDARRATDGRDVDRAACVAALRRH